MHTPVQTRWACNPFSKLSVPRASQTVFKFKQFYKEPEPKQNENPLVRVFVSTETEAESILFKEVSLS